MIPLARDTPRSIIYALDIELKEMIKPALRGGFSTIEMYGTTVDLPRKLDFTTLDEMRSYINTKILGNPHLTAIYGDVPYVRVVQSQQRSSNVKQSTLKNRTPIRYDPRSHTIHVAMTDSGMSVVTAAHESAHALTHNAGLGGGHGERFLEAYISIYDVIAGPSMAWAVRAIHDQIRRA